MNDEQTVDEWADSFEVGSDDAPETPETPEVEEAPEEPEATPEPEAEEEAPEETPEETPEEAPEAEEEVKEEPEAPEVPEEKPSLSSEDIKKALREVEAEKASYTDEVKSTTKEVLESFYPEGIDRQLRDKDGDPIKSIEDVMERIDPRTGENFTEERAASWLLEEQQKLNKQVEELEASAERVAEVNINLKKDAERVVEKYADVLKNNPKVAEKARALYENTLRKDPKTGITLEAPLDLIEFYDTFLEPYILAAENTPAPEPVVEPEKPKANPNDRADLPTTNGNDNLSKEEREWAEIAAEYQSIRN